MKCFAIKAYIYNHLKKTVDLKRKFGRNISINYPKYADGPVVIMLHNALTVNMNEIIYNVLTTKRVCGWVISN